MIQRIQTVYLFLIFCLMMVMLFVPATDNISYYWLFFGFSGLIALLTASTIFLFKNRKLQIKSCKLILLLLVLYYVGIFAFVVKFPIQVPITELGFRFTVCFPLIAIILDLLAISGIKRDEKLVRSADRLR